jgi:hypothetical protein
MAAYVMVTIKAHDLAWLGEYSANVPAIIARHGGDYLAVSDTIRRMEGDGLDPNSIVLLTLPLDGGDRRVPGRSRLRALQGGTACSHVGRDVCLHPTRVIDPNRMMPGRYIGARLCG